MNHTSIINRIIASRGYETYLEIGVQNPNNNFNLIGASYSVGVDPNVSAPCVMQIMSDKFFKYNSTFFDVIFVDGNHSYEQSRRDIDNAMQNVTANGVVIVHDVLPKTKEATGDVQKVRGKPWNGEVYRAWAEVMGSVANVCYTIDHEEGIGIYEAGKYPDLYKFEAVKMDWIKYTTDRDKCMRIVSLDAWLKMEDENELRRIDKQVRA